jgi:hypothetical protein
MKSTQKVRRMYVEYAKSVLSMVVWICKITPFSTLLKLLIEPFLVGISMKSRYP